MMAWRWQYGWLWPQRLVWADLTLQPPSLKGRGSFTAWPPLHGTWSGGMVWRGASARCRRDEWRGFDCLWRFGAGGLV